MKHHSVYKGCNIYINTERGHSLKWSSYVGGQFCYADTLQGIKNLIRKGE